MIPARAGTLTFRRASSRLLRLWLTLVAVEFIVPYNIAPREGPAPRLFDQDFLHNGDFQIWMLHAWISKNNPSGMFASGNPTVNCDAVAASQRLSHDSR